MYVVLSNGRCSRTYLQGDMSIEGIQVFKNNKNMGDDIFSFSPKICKRIHQVPRIKAGYQKNIIPDKAMDYYVKKFIRPLSRFVDIEKTTVVDCSCGFGWFANAYALYGGKSVIAADIDFTSVQTAREVSKILGIDHKVHCITTSITELALKSQSIPFFVTLETLEHIGDAYYNSRKKEQLDMSNGIEEIKRVTTDFILVRMPNQLFPKDWHDSFLFFYHWLPPALRKIYGKLFNKYKRQWDVDYDAHYVSHFTFEKLINEYDLVTPFCCYDKPQDYIDTYPLYDANSGQADDLMLNPIHPKKTKLLFKLLGRNSRFFLPSIDGIYKKRQSHNRE